MLEGNVRAAVRWLTECSGRAVLRPSDSTTIGETSMTVLEKLSLKHPNPCTPLPLASSQFDLSAQEVYWC